METLYPSVPAPFMERTPPPHAVYPALSTYWVYNVEHFLKKSTETLDSVPPNPFDNVAAGWLSVIGPLCASTRRPEQGKTKFPMKPHSITAYIQELGMVSGGIQIKSWLAGSSAAQVVPLQTDGPVIVRINTLLPSQFPFSPDSSHSLPNLTLLAHLFFPVPLLFAFVAGPFGFRQSKSSSLPRISTGTGQS